MRTWKTILWIVVLSFLSVSCGSRNDPNQQIVTDPSQLLGPSSGYGSYPQYGTNYTPQTTGGYGMPVLYGADGVYLGAAVPLNADPESICNPAGEFGAPTSPTSIWNYYGAYGNPGSPLSATNPASTSPPTRCYWDGAQVANCDAFISANTNLGYPTYNPLQLRQSVCGY